MTAVGSNCSRDLESFSLRGLAKREEEELILFDAIYTSGQFQQIGNSCLPKRKPCRRPSKQVVSPTNNKLLLISVSVPYCPKNTTAMPWREAEYPASLHVVNLRQTSAWIRDDLDRLIARQGPNALHPDDVLTLHSIFLNLQQHKISLATMRFSRIHLAVSDVCGKATRWPKKLADEADRVVLLFEECFGPLKAIRTPLYEVGGQLHGISEPRDLTRDVSGHVFGLSLQCDGIR